MGDFLVAQADSYWYTVSNPSCHRSLNSVERLLIHNKNRLDEMVNEKAQEAVQKSLDSVTGDASAGVAGIVFVAVDKDGKQICAVPSGKKGVNNRDEMTMDTVFWIASCTKLLATMACMQAFEQGKVKLDDAEFIYQQCPELKDVKVLQEDGTLRDKKNDITLRMLLSHMSGFGYELYVTVSRFDMLELTVIASTHG